MQGRERQRASAAWAAWRSAHPGLARGHVLYRERERRGVDGWESLGGGWEAPAPVMGGPESPSAPVLADEAAWAPRPKLCPRIAQILRFMPSLSAESIK